MLEVLESVLAKRGLACVGDLVTPVSSDATMLPVLRSTAMCELRATVRLIWRFAGG